MKALHVITGLPRSGSTLMCNVLNQNPEFHATSTDILPQLLAGAAYTCSTSPEVKSLLVHNRPQATERVVNLLRAMVNGWLEHAGDKVIFDKSRGWSSHALLLRQLFPDTKIIVMVRDLRAICASVEKQHRKEPIFDLAATPQDKALYNRADGMFGPGGMIGGPLGGVEDLLRRDLPGTVYVQYETFAQNPKATMDRVYQAVELDPFAHDFDNVKNTATDCDDLYLNKFPHEGSGKIEAPSHGDWKQFVSADLAVTIMQRFPRFNAAFGYK